MQIHFCCFHAIVISSEKSKANVTFQPAAAQPQLGSQHLLGTREDGGCKCPNVKCLFRDICTRDFQQEKTKPPVKQTKRFNQDPQTLAQQKFWLTAWVVHLILVPLTPKISKRFELKCTKPIEKVRFWENFLQSVILKPSHHSHRDDKRLTSHATQNEKVFTTTHSLLPSQC